jgi:hypothetical protein
MSVPALPGFKDDIICKRTASGIETNVPRRIIEHSPTGMEWGYGGSGPADFALNILSIFIGEDAARYNGLYQLFKQEFVSPLPQAGGTIPRQAIEKWLEVQAAEGKIRHTVKITLEDDEAASLAVLCYKIDMGKLEHFSADEIGKRILSDIMAPIRDQLWAQGYNPADVHHTEPVSGNP